MAGLIRHHVGCHDAGGSKVVLVSCLKRPQERSDEGHLALVLVVSIHQMADSDRRIWSHVAIAFATAYAILVSVTYYVQLTLVVPRHDSGAS